MKISWKAVVAVGLALTVLYAANFLYAVFSDQSGGTFGDTFGAVNALFSGSALFFLALAFLSQREELNLVREERNDTKKLLEGQEDINKKQKSALDQQSFEQSFYAMLSLINQEKARLLSQPKDYNAKPPLDEISDKCEAGLQSLARDPNFLEVINPETDLLIDQAFHYTKLICSAVYLIDKTDNSSIDKKFYRSVMQSTVDLRTANCIAWFHASANFSNEDFNSTYSTLHIEKTIQRHSATAIRTVMKNAIS